MELLGYIRVSRVGGREGDSFISPRQQRESITAYAAALGHTVTFLPDELDASGGKASRPVFQDALERCEQGLAGGMIVAKLDRFARSVPDAAVAIRRLEDAGAVLVSVADQLDTGTPMGRFARTMMLAIAELELERLRDSWAAAKSDAVRRGIHVSSYAPAGYVRGVDRRLVPDPAAAPVIEDAFRMRGAGGQLESIARMMNERGVRSYQGGEWGGRTVALLLRNRVYLGEARAGEYVQRDAHPAIVSRGVWEAAQVAVTVQEPRSADGYLLSGILRCAGCRYKMAGQGGARNHSYRCKNPRAAGPCPAPAGVDMVKADEWVEQVFLERVQAGSLLAVAAPSDDVVAAAEQALRDAELGLAEFRDDVEYARLLGRESHLAGIESRLATVDEARKALAEAQASTGVAEGLPDSVTLLDAWPALTTVERRQLLHAGIDAVMISASGRGRRVPIVERCHVLWHGEAPDDLPRRGVFAPIKSFDIRRGE